MIKVVVADDEEKVCQLIANIIDWNRYGFEIVHVANDGRDALEYSLENEVDVLLTDIRMPGIDGMELIEEINIKKPDVYLVIISGYNQFDYAQNAIRCGVDDYLLKPINSKELLSTLTKITEKYYEENQNTMLIEELEQEAEESKMKEKQRFLEDILMKREKFGGYFDIAEINRKYHLNITKRYLQVVVIKIIVVDGIEVDKTKRLILGKGLEIVQDAMLCEQNVVCSIVGNEICGLLNFEEGEGGELEAKIKRIKLELLRLKELFGEIKVFIGLGNKRVELAEVEASFLQAKKVLNDRFYDANQHLYKAKDLLNKDELDVIIDNEFKKRFLNAVEILDFSNIEELLNECEYILKCNERKVGEQVISTYKEILNLYYFATHNYNIEIEDEFLMLLDRIESFYSIETLMKFLSGYIRRSLEQWLEKKENIEIRPIRIAKQYINENYHNNITLEEISKVVGFNSTYFSTIFKKETSMNFTEYLKMVRVKYAKDLLLESRYCVEDVSFSVGYSDVKYFSKLFKKMTGITPSEFRKLYM